VDHVRVRRASMEDSFRSFAASQAGWATSEGGRAPRKESGERSRGVGGAPGGSMAGSGGGGALRGGGRRPALWRVRNGIPSLWMEARGRSAPLAWPRGSYEERDGRGRRLSEAKPPSGLSSGVRIGSC
jgi:hypothetical protein